MNAAPNHAESTPLAGPEATARALATLEQSLAQAAALAAENATMIQQQENAAAQAALASAVSLLLGAPEAK